MVYHLSAFSSYVLPSAVLGSCTVGIVPASILGGSYYLSSKAVSLTLGIPSITNLTAEVKKCVLEKGFKTLSSDKVVSRNLTELAAQVFKFFLTCAITCFCLSTLGLGSPSLLSVAGFIATVFTLQNLYHRITEESLEHKLSTLFSGCIQPSSPSFYQRDPRFPGTGRPLSG